MKFPRQFKRYVGELPPGGIKLGDDKRPEAPPRTRDGNQLAMRLSNINGFSLQRVAVGCHAPKGAPPLPATLYVHEDSTGFWFRSEVKSRELVPDSFVYFDMPIVPDNSNAASHEVGTLEVCLVVERPANAPDGEYVFVISGDVSCPV